jgi:hypothetical protein
MDLAKFKGLGAGVGGGWWSPDNILAAAQYSPQLALAKAMRVPFSPFVLTIANTFTDTTTLISNMQTFQSDAQSGVTDLGGEPTIIDGLVYEIDQPQAYAGSVLKSVSDYFYGLNSGIQATMMVSGAPKYTVAPFFTPLKILLDSLNEAWACGWVLGHNQSIIMQFQQTVPVVAPPTTVTVGFRMWQPIDTAGIFVQMTTGEAYQRLQAMGYEVGSAQQPVNR